jgi:hypothetical protein
MVHELTETTLAPSKAPDGGQRFLGLLRALLAFDDAGGDPCRLRLRPRISRLATFFPAIEQVWRDPNLMAQFPLAEEAAAALGLVVWPMVEFEADDALATAAARFENEQVVEQIIICSPDKDLAQLVSGSRIVCWDRRRDIVLDEAGVREKYGVGPQSIPDWLALVGDSADGYPGILGWGAKCLAVLFDMSAWKLSPTIRKDGVGPAGVHVLPSLANTGDVLLYRQLAMLAWMFRSRRRLASGVAGPRAVERDLSRTG